MGKMVMNVENISPPVIRRTPHFFKVLLPNLTTHHLRIPPEFMKYISNEESDRAILEGPTGSHWHVKLSKTEDGTFLQDGWQDFVRDHSICHYEFLVFRYDGIMCFNVKVFDKSGFEREDAFTTKPQGLVFPIDKKFVSYAGKKRGRPPEKCAGSAALFASRACQRDPGIEKFAEKRIRTEDASKPTHERDSQARLCLSRRKPETEEIKAKVWRATASFSSRYPYFAKCLDWYSVARTRVLYIPAGFSKVHLPRFSTKAILRISRGLDWIVKLKCNGGKCSYICGGWAAFLHGNELKQGDICIFELVGKCEFCVHIFPVGLL